MNTKLIMERLEEILDDLVDELDPVKPECDAVENYLSQVYSIMDSEYLAFPVMFLEAGLSKAACFVFGFISHVYFTDTELHYGIGVFRLGVCAKFLKLEEKEVLDAIKEIEAFSNGKFNRVEFQIEGDLVFTRQKM